MSIPSNNLDEISSLVGYRLRELRIKAGFKSYEQFAYKNNISRIQYWKMENGNNFTLKSLLRVLDAHAIRINDFLALFGNNYTAKSPQAKRLEKVNEHTGLSKMEFSHAIGYKNLTNINHSLLGGKPLSKKLISRIENTFPSINSKWLIDGKGLMLIGIKQ